MVREATVADARAIAEVQVRAWRAAYGGFLPRQLLDEMSEGLREASWQEMLGDESPGGFTLVATNEGGSVEGFCSMALPSRDEDADERTAEVATAYVDPARWGSGVGRALLSEAFRRLRDGEWEDVTLWVFLRNAQGRAFFARSGFRLDGRNDVHEASGARTARMRARLPG
jgi:L-amino acid N-acyltransferase YncA